MRSLFGDKNFYKRLLLLAVPIMVQNAITNFVGFLDNIMVGQLGTEPMSGVAIVNQLVFVFNLLVFGGFSGAGIFGAQFFGHSDHEGVRSTFRFKVWMGAVIAVITLTTFIVFGRQLIGFYLTSGDGGDLSLTFEHAEAYLLIIILEIIPFIVVQIYASTLRETGQTMVPMLAGIVAVFVNLIFNYILIFGKLGAPELGVRGAAIATVFARLVECSIVVIWTHKNRIRNVFIQGAYRSMKIPLTLVKNIMIKGMPLLFNEVLWAGAIAVVNQCFSVRGLSVVAATNISSTIGNLFNVVFIALGNAVAILVGQQLGAEKFEQAKDTAKKVITFTVLCTCGMTVLMILMSGLFPGMYNTSDEVRSLAARMIQITACMMPVQAFLNTVYFTIRAGGKTGITFLFDSGFSWVVSLPAAFLLVYLTSLDILTIYTIYLMLDIIKAGVGLFIFKKGIWVQNIIQKGGII